MPKLPAPPPMPKVPDPPPIPKVPDLPTAPAIPTPPTPPKLPSPPAPPAVPKVPGVTGGGAANAQRNSGDPAVQLRFHLHLDNQNIGWWNSFEGLGMDTAIEQREEGGNNAWVHQLPTRLKYSNVKLSRPINEDSEKVAVWFMAIAQKVKRGSTAQIKAVDGQGKVIAQWSLNDVVPVRWTGPTFKVDAPQVATETIELAFHGFIAPVAKGGS
jgi:phage tail-like protein